MLQGFCEALVKGKGDEWGSIGAVCVEGSSGRGRHGSSFFCEFWTSYRGLAALLLCVRWVGFLAEASWEGSLAQVVGVPAAGLPGLDPVHASPLDGGQERRFIYELPV
jgi:hypothetical protein